MFDPNQSRKLFETRWWEGEAGIKIPAKTLATFQLSQTALCMPYEVFHRAVEDATGAGIAPHNLISMRHDLLKNLIGKKYELTDAECLQLLPIHAREVLK